MTDGPEARGPFKVSRRDFFVATGAAALAGGVGLVLGTYVGVRLERHAKRVPARPQPFAPSVYLAIDGEGLVTVWLTRSEMGQGVGTALPMLVAEELDADFGRVRVEHAVANRNYGSQFTVGSGSVRHLWLPLRQAGAAAREMLVAAAAAQWGVTPGECEAREGAVRHRQDGRRIPFGALVTMAAKLPVPDNPRLKRPDERRLMGTAVPRLDLPAKGDGSARFGLDVRLPGLRFATVVRCPVFGGKAKSFDAASVTKLPGVHEVFDIGAGIAIVGANSWVVLEAAKQLRVDWDEGPHGSIDSAVIGRQLDSALEREGQLVEEGGDVGLWHKARTIEARYAAPYLAHATMEPINATAWMQDGHCEVWAPTQAPGKAQQLAMELTGLKEPNVVVHVTLLGGGFGRRSSTVEVGDAVRIAQRVKGPVQVVWSREQDVQHDSYRPIVRQRLEAALDAEGRPTAWRHRVATPAEPSWAPGQVSGATGLPYALDRVEVRWTGGAPPVVPTGAWRSVAHSYTAFAVESFIDEVAHAGGRDPVDLRRLLLRDAPRDLAVLERAVEASGWTDEPAEGIGRGVALHPAFGSHIALVAEVELRDGELRVPRVVAAVDCGQTINPNIIAAQVEGGINFGLSAALHEQIDVRDGRTVQSNFHDYRLLRFPEAPEIEVHIIASDEEPGGIGELAVPPVAPAVANALFALTGTRLRSLPFSLG